MGVDLQADFILFDLITAGGEGGVVVETPENCSSSLIFTNAGIGLGAFYNLFSCFSIAAGGALGMYNYSYDNGEKTIQLQIYTIGLMEN